MYEIESDPAADELATLIRAALNTARESGYQRARSIWASGEPDAELAAGAAQTNADVASVRMWSALYGYCDSDATAARAARQTGAQL